MKRRIVQRYVATEILIPFALGLFVLTFVIMMFQILKVTDLMVNYGLRLGDVIRVFLYLLPPFTVFTLPMAFLLGVMLAVGRLSSDSEIVAMKASGISLLQLLPPVLALGVLSFFAAAFLSLWADPWGKTQSKLMLERVGTQFAGALIKEKVFNTELDNLVIYVEEIDTRTREMRGIFLSDESNPELPMIITAESGRVLHSPSGSKVVFQLESGAIHRSTSDSSVYDAAFFERNEIVYDVRRGIQGDAVRRSYLDMTLPELSGHVTQLRAKLASGVADKDERRETEREMRRSWVEYHRKFAFPFACVVFGIIGLPLGVVAPRSGRGQGFTLAIIVLCSYYLLFRVGENLGWKDALHPAVAMWAPNVLFLAFGLYLIRARTLERPSRVRDALADVTATLSRRLSRRAGRGGAP